jgi:PAS domain S-box-containing protein
MIGMRGSLTRKLTAMNLLVSGVALLLASAAFFAYDLFTFRTNLIANTSTQARMIGSNAVSPLVFNDPESVETTLSALRASTHINYAAVYAANGDFFSGYWRQQSTGALRLPPFYLSEGEKYWFADGQFHLLQTILFEDRPVGAVYIRSDLDAIYDRLKTYSLILLAILAGSLVAALAISRLSQRVISEPILGLAEAARQVTRNKDYSVRARSSSDGDEVGLLVAAFNEMLLEIQTRDSALQESEQQFRSLADSIPQLAWMGDAQGNLFWYNRRWFEYTGTSPTDMEGWGWQSVHDPEVLPQVMEKWKNSIATGKAFEMTFPLRAQDGSYRYFLTLALPVRDAHGAVARWFGTNTDVTEQRRSAEALRQTEKLAATGRLAASIAHEINNPLEAVTNLVYLARKQPANAPKYLDLADNELDRIAQITKNTLGFYRDSASPSEVNIPEVLEEVLALYVRKLNFKKIDLRNESTDGARVLAYPGEVRQIFANLISNAIEALPDEGQLRIRTSKTHATDGTNRPGVRVTFLDNGSGVAREHRQKIFEPFFTTKKDVGTGLGLWLTLGLIEKHKGLLRVRSNATPTKSWTAFSVFLPETP